MLFFGMRRRSAGKPIPTWQLHSARFSRGHLLTVDKRCPELNRVVRVARFVHAEQMHDLWPELNDFQLLQVRPDYLVLQGLEHDPVDGVDACQTWLLYSTDPDAGPISFDAPDQSGL